MIKFDNDIGPCKVITKEELAAHTDEGWQLVAVLEEKVAKYCCEVMPDPNGIPGATTTTDRYLPVTQVTYLVAQGSNKRAKKLGQIIRDLRKELASALGAKTELEIQLADTKADAEVQLANTKANVEAQLENSKAFFKTQHEDALNKELARVRDQEVIAQKMITEDNGTINNLKHQMHVVWTHFGVSQMREALGDDVECPIELPPIKTAHERLIADEDDNECPF
jgi:hypothetical protein